MVERLREGHDAQQKVVDQYNAKCDSIRKQSEKAELDEHGDGPMSEAWRQYDAKRSHLQGQAETQIETIKKEMAIHEMLVNQYNHLILTHENVLRPYAKE